MMLNDLQSMVLQYNKRQEILTSTLVQRVHKRNKLTKVPAQKNAGHKKDHSQRGYELEILTNHQTHFGDPRDSWLPDPHFYCMQ
jgi:hypothetical protein